MALVGSGGKWPLAGPVGPPWEEVDVMMEKNGDGCVGFSLGLGDVAGGENKDDMGFAGEETLGEDSSTSIWSPTLFFSNLLALAAAAASSLAALAAAIFWASLDNGFFSDWEGD